MGLRRTTNVCSHCLAAKGAARKGNEGETEGEEASFGRLWPHWSLWGALALARTRARAARPARSSYARAKDVWQLSVEEPSGCRKNSPGQNRNHVGPGRPEQGAKCLQGGHA